MVRSRYAPCVQLRPSLQGNPEIYRLRRLDAVETWSGHSDNRKRDTFNIEGLPDYVRIS
jgi:hypothetical protein